MNESLSMVLAQVCDLEKRRRELHTAQIKARATGAYKKV